MASALLKPDINTVHRAPTTAAPAPAIGCIPIVSATATTAAHAMPAVSALPNTLPVLRFQVATRVSSQFSLAGVRSVDVPLGLITARRLLPLDVLGVRFTHERFQLLSDRPSCRDGLSELTELVVDGLVDRKPRAFQPVGVEIGRASCRERGRSWAGARAAKEHRGHAHHRDAVTAPSTT